jgi:hypothetical protein
VTATSPTTGTVEIGNYNQGVGYILEITVSTPLCQKNVEWIVEDLTVGGLAPLDDWGTVIFSGASATTLGGSTVGPAGAQTIGLILNNGDPNDGKTVSYTEIDGDNVAVRYVAP